MTREQVFSSAIWISRAGGDFPVLRRVFTLPEGAVIKKATLRAVGLGYCKTYVNGTDLAPCSFLPFSTDYEARADYPVGEELTGHRLYVPEFDVTGLLRGGRNLLTLFFGGGWYCFWSRNFMKKRLHYYDEKLRYGDAKAIYRLTVETDCGEFEFVSSTADRLTEGGVYDYCFSSCECRDLTALPEETFTDPDYDDSGWDKAVEMPALDTEYLFTDCPADALIERLPVKKTASGVWDCGVNTAGYPVLMLNGRAGEKVTVCMSEDLDAEGGLDTAHMHGQTFEVVCDGREKEVHPEFIWFGFRYFTVEGPAQPVCVDVVHADVKVTSSFDSDNPVLNYLYQTYINTQLANLHGGIPSDCPHIERRGYTGDGELTAHAVMTTIGAKEFYKKWIEDISDCQDKVSGHIQYTAPYINSGGGPGAWGCAIVEVPWQYYKHYGDPKPMLRLYPQMKEYFRFLEEHSENGFIVSDQPKNWCLGDWCCPDLMLIPPQFVNNYYYIKSLTRAIEIAKMQGLNDDAALFEKRIAERKKAITAAYFTKGDSCYCANLQGANAFAVDIGMGNGETIRKMAEHYRKTGEFDTGICGTDVLIRVLFESGEAELAVDLLSSEKPNSFGALKEKGATTLWEYWPADVRGSRSLNHPMFGAVTAYLFEYVLGIRQREGTAGYGDLVISPCFVPGRACGSQTLPGGEVKVAYGKCGDTVRVEITVPAGIAAEFKYADETRPLNAGTNRFSIKYN